MWWLNRHLFLAYSIVQIVCGEWLGSLLYSLSMTQADGGSVLFNGGLLRLPLGICSPVARRGKRTWRGEKHMGGFMDHP